MRGEESNSHDTSESSEKFSRHGAQELPPLTNIKRDDTVRCEFEARVLEIDEDDDTLYLELPSEHLYFYRSDFTRLEVVAPKTQPGDMVLAWGHIWIANSFWKDGEGGWFYRVSTPSIDPAETTEDKFPADAVWVRRGGILNPLLTGEQ